MIMDREGIGNVITGITNRTLNLVDKRSYTSVLLR